MSKFYPLFPPHLSLLYCPTSHILLSLRHHLPLSVAFIQLQLLLTTSPSIDQFTSTSFTFSLLQIHSIHFPNGTVLILLLTTFIFTPLHFHSKRQQQSSCSPFSIHTFLSHTLHIIHSTLISLLLQLHVITQL